MYTVLGIQSSASPEEIRVAFKRGALATHPDKGGSATGFQQAMAAFETLADPQRRAKHDQYLACTAVVARRKRKPQPKSPRPKSPFKDSINKKNKRCKAEKYSNRKHAPSSESVTPNYGNSLFLLIFGKSCEPALGTSTHYRTTSTTFSENRASQF